MGNEQVVNISLPISLIIVFASGTDLANLSRIAVTTLSFLYPFCVRNFHTYAGIVAIPIPLPTHSPIARRGSHCLANAARPHGYPEPP